MLIQTVDFAGSCDAVLYWVEALRHGAARELWGVLDTDLRLVIAQDFILATTGVPDDARAAELAAWGAQGPVFSRMVAAVVRRWRQTHAGLANGVTFDGRPESVGADLEVVVAYGRPAFGARRARQDGEPHLFITRRSRSHGWSIAAAGPKLPAPGWPPTSWLIPQLRKDDGL